MGKSDEMFDFSLESLWTLTVSKAAGLLSVGVLPLVAPSPPSVGLAVPGAAA